MSHDIMIGCVGKPSSGKSSFFNACTDSNAKIGNYPFTTIEPNIGIGFYQVECACKKFKLENLCKPRYGHCIEGRRYIPIKLLDVAGLIPGASEGKGLGNKFLDDLRHADILLHIIDSSGRTNEKGEETTGYDPTFDALWLESEIVDWIFNNLMDKWQSVVRKHSMQKQALAVSLQSKLSGYGSKQILIAVILQKMGIKDPVDISLWTNDDVRKFVVEFVKERFQIILVLNKVDLQESAKKHNEDFQKIWRSKHGIM